MAKKKSKIKKSAPSSEKARKEALAVTGANIVRIEAAEKSGSSEKPKTPTKGRTGKAKKEKRLSVLDFAARVLVAAKEPLDTKTIAERTIAAGWATNGKTPHSTLYAAIIREIAGKGKQSRFKKMDRGMFAAPAGVK